MVMADVKNESVKEADDTITVFEWHPTYFRSRRVRIARCPNAGSAWAYPHELTVADCFDDELSHVYCTCGWIGPGASTDEIAVEIHNRPHGLGIEPTTEWERSECSSLEDPSPFDMELPF